MNSLAALEKDKGELTSKLHAAAREQEAVREGARPATIAASLSSFALLSLPPTPSTVFSLCSLQALIEIPKL